MHYLKQILIATDQLINTLFGGWADETLSSRAYRRYITIGAGFWDRLPCKIIDKIFFWDKEYIPYEMDWCGYEDRPPRLVRHCELSYISEQKRLQSAPEFRKDI